MNIPTTLTQSHNLWLNLTDGSESVFVTVDTGQSNSASNWTTVDTGQSNSASNWTTVDNGQSNSASQWTTETNSVPILIATGGQVFQQTNSGLDSLATAASTQLVKNNQNVIQIGSGQFIQLPLAPDPDVLNGNVSKLYCNDCSTPFDSGESFFQHWLDRHCKLENPDKTIETATLEDAESTPHCSLCKEVLDDSQTHACKGKPMKRKHDMTKLAKKPINTPLPPHSSICCGVCSLSVRTITSFFLHWLDKHNDLEVLLQEVWQCFRCNPSKLFPDQKRAFSHITEHDEKLLSNVKCVFKGCEKLLFVTSKDLEFHRNLHSAKKCCKCESIMSDPVDHFVKVHQTPCQICHCQISVDDMSVHLSQYHRIAMVWNRQNKLLQIAEEVEPNKDVKEEKKVRKLLSKADSKTTPVTTISPPSVKCGTNCSSCGLFFNSEKLLEKHFVANHDFQCKFCDAKMDKDLYGDHLRQHLAKQRKKATNT